MYSVPADAQQIDVDSAIVDIAYDTLRADEGNTDFEISKLSAVKIDILKSVSDRSLCVVFHIASMARRLFK